MIFPRADINIEKLDATLSYPLDVFNKDKHKQETKKLLKTLKSKLLKMLKEWEKYKPVRDQIEDFFKVTKQTFGLDKIHKFSKNTASKTIYLTILLTTLAIQEGYKSKTGMQELTEGQLDQDKRKKYKKRKEKTRNREKGRCTLRTTANINFQTIKRKAEHTPKFHIFLAPYKLYNHTNN